MAGIIFTMRPTKGLPAFTRILALQDARLLTHPVTVANKDLFKLNLMFVAVIVCYKVVFLLKTSVFTSR